MYCNSCASKLPEGSRFCNSCGAKVTACSGGAEQISTGSSYSFVPPKDKAREVIFEPKQTEAKPASGEKSRRCGCGAALKADMKFCNQCGKKVDIASEAPGRAERREEKKTPPARRCACGTELKEGLRFCTQCGKKVGDSHSTPQRPAHEDKQVPKKRAMRTVAAVLLVINVVALLGSISNGDLSSMLSGGLSGIMELLGFCAPAIIGCVLLYIDHKRNGGG